MIIGRFAVTPHLVLGAEMVRDDGAEKMRVTIYYTEDMIELSQFATKVSEAEAWMAQVDLCITQAADERAEERRCCDD